MARGSKARKPRLWHLGMVTTLVAAVLTAGAPAAPASAATCETGSTRTSRTLSSASVYLGNANNRVYGQSGGTITISYGETWTTTGTLSVSGTANAGVVFANVSVTVGVSVSYSRATSATSSYTWKVPKSQKTGWVERGNYGYKGAYTYGYYKSPCTWVELGSGSYKGATSRPWYTHS